MTANLDDMMAAGMTVSKRAPPVVLLRGLTLSAKSDLDPEVGPRFDRS